MARRRFTNIILALVLLCSIVSSIRVEAQQVTFALSPTRVTPAVGDLINLDIVVQNFTNVVSFQYAIEWDGALLAFDTVNNVTVPDRGAFLANPFGGNSVLVGWNAVGAAKTVSNGQSLFRLRLRVLAASSNYWAKFSGNNLDMEIIQDPGLRSVTPTLISLGIPPGASTTPIIAKATGSSTLTGQKVCVPVTVSDFTSVVSAQWVNKWNPAILRFDSVSALNSTLGLRTTNFGTTQANSGRLSFSWNAPSGSVSVQNNDVLYNVCYTAVGGNGTSAVVSFDSSEVYRRSAVGDSRAALNSTNGTVTVGTVVLPPTTGLVFAASNETVATGETVCVKIKTGGFKDIAVAQWSMHFDSTKMTLIGASSNADLGIAPWTSTTSQGDFNNLINGNQSGTIRFLWVSPSGNGYTLSDSTTVMELCFRYIGAANTNSIVRFDGIPLKIQVKDGNLVTLIPNFRSGNVSTAVAVATNFTSTVENVNCPSGTDGKITLSPTGGNGTYTYSWTGPNGFVASSKDLTARTAGTYAVTVTSNGTSKTSSFTITEPAAFALSTQVINVSCKGGTNGAVRLTASGGTAPYTYNWSGTTTTPTAKDLLNLTAGIYKLTLTDAKSCTAPLTETLTEPDSVKVGTATIVGTRCSQPTGKITVTAATGGNGTYTYSWTGPNSYTASGLSLTGIAAGNYVLTVKDSKLCEASATFTVVDTAANITISTPTITGVTCFDGQNGAISLTATASSPLTYAWTGPNGFTASTLAISNLFAGNYNVSVSDGSCSKVVSATVTQAAAIVSAPQSVSIKCKDALTGSIALNATGGTAPLSITWSSANGFTGAGQSIGSLAAGTYTAVILDANLCRKTESVTLTQPTETLKVTNAAIKNVACTNDSNGEIVVTVAGGTPQYTYTWTGAGANSLTSSTISNLSGGEYRLTVSDANGCTASNIYNVVIPTPIVINSGSTDAGGTPNGTISLNPTGGTAPYSYSWTGQGVSPNAQNQTGLCSGTYSVNVTDAAQCSASKSIVVGGSCSTPMRVLGTASITPAGCAGNNLGQISINWEGGVAPFTVVWVQIINTNAIDVFSQIVQARNSVLANRPAGTYAIKITDAVGQTLATPPMIVNGSVTPVTVTTAISDETCRGTDGSIALSIGAGASPFKVKWGDITADVTVRTNLVAGNYRATVSDANGCLKPMDDIFVKRMPCPLVATSTKVNPTCFGGTNGSITIEITNGEPTYTVTSSGGTVARGANSNPRGGSYTVNGLSAGTYTIVIRDTINPTQTIVQTLTAPTQITVERRVTGDQGSCNGSIILTPTGGVGNFSYLWNTGATSRDLFNLCCNDGRRYSVRVKDANDCVVETPNDTIACNIAALSLSSTNVRNPLCQNDSLNSRIDVQTTGGVLPLIYEWRNQLGTPVGSNSPILLNQPPGRYYLTVSDSRSPNPQRTTFDALLKVTSTLAFGRIDLSPATDNIAADGACTFAINEGAPPYSVRWPDGSTTVVQTSSATNSTLKAGKGEILVTDLQGCVIKTEITIPSKACATLRTNTVFYTPKPDTFNVKCAKNADGGATVLSLSADYRTPIRTYQWSSGEVGATAFKLAPGFNTVTITDADGKTCVSRLFMKAPEVLNDTIWKDDKARTLEAIATGGVKPYTYLWTTDNLETTAKVTVTRSGKYVNTVTDFFGCQAQDIEEIVINATCLDGSVILTPNDDGRNENFRFKSCDIKKVRLEVYNRWGQVVYSKDDYRDEWYGNKEDGQTGEQLPEGVYMYVLSGVDAAGKRQLGKGTVNIVRY